MKTRFSSVDIRAVINDIRGKLQGLRVANVYDIDNKTYLIKLAKPDQKYVLLLESGIRIHTTEFEWPKNMTPSGFSMKLRKHLRTRRLEKIEQLGVDRIVDLTFGSGEAAYHVIVELYDRGNLVLTDHEYNILNILRARTDKDEDVRFAVREKYPVHTARQLEALPTQDQVASILLTAKKEENLKRVLSPFIYGPVLMEHCLIEAGFPPNSRIGKEVNIESDLGKLMGVIERAHELFLDFDKSSSKGYITVKRDKKADGSEVVTYTEFHPWRFKQFEKQECTELVTFDRAVDEFFSKLGSQKLDVKALQQEKAALRKLDNVRKDHEKRLGALHQEQEMDQVKAACIENNLQLVEDAILIIQNALANQIDWSEINELVKEAKSQGNPVACAIKSLQLNTNHITMILSSPDPEQDSDSDGEEDSQDRRKHSKPLAVTIDLGLSAYANSKKYYDMKRSAAMKEQKTIESSEKALKSANRKTKETLKEMAVRDTINKARKVYWFEKFLWFISSENFLVIGGRDQQQNEIIVKKYLRPGDVYVHADVRGATSVVVKNHTGNPLPPKTLEEAGAMAVCHSAAWDARIVTSAWWVHHHQVSKTAPSGEYLTTGSFMIRGKKNFLPPSYLMYGFGFLFKIDDDSVFRHKDERKIRGLDNEEIDSKDADQPPVKSEPDKQSAADEADKQANDADEIPDDDADNMDELHISDDSSDEDEIDQEAATADQHVDEHDQASEQHVQSSNESDQSQDEDVRQNKEDRDVDAVKVEEEQEEEELFPDTSITFTHKPGMKSSLSVQRSSSHVSNEDDNISETSETASIKSSKGGRMSAKQRRLLKKQAKEGTAPASVPEPSTSAVHIQQEGDNSASEEGKVVADEEQQETKQQQPQPSHQPAKRGKKGKMKKIKEKYKDQDDEERALRMAILGSAGAPKESKRSKRHQQNEKATQRREQQKNNKAFRLGAQDIKMDLLSLHDPNAAPEQTPVLQDEDDSDDERQAILEEEKVQLAENIGILDTLTGQPDPDDNLLFCLAVAAPYSTLVNYKYKVKLTPGTTKRGKATKASIFSFMQDRAATTREKDLLKSVKEVDNSRNLPGKVKVSAPNLHKAKHK